MEYAILGNAAFFAVAFAMQIGCMSWDMLGFGQNDDDIAVKNLIQNQIPKTRKTPITRRLGALGINVAGARSGGLATRDGDGRDTGARGQQGFFQCVLNFHDNW